MRAKFFEIHQTLRIALTNAAVAVRGEMACIDTATGLLVPAATSTTLLPIGYFGQDAVGDGTTKVLVELFGPVRLDYFTSAGAGGAIAEDDIGKLCYVEDGGLVTLDSTGASIAGRILRVDPIDGIGVRMTDGL
jgi:hypothetical protein